MFQVIYIPRVEDEVIIAEYYTIEEADDHMESIKSQSLKAHKHHYIKEKA